MQQSGRLQSRHRLAAPKIPQTRSGDKAVAGPARDVNLPAKTAAITIT
jgi:hypothetical protein